MLYIRFSVNKTMKTNHGANSVIPWMLKYESHIQNAACCTELHYDYTHPQVCAFCQKLQFPAV